MKKLVVLLTLALFATGAMAQPIDSDLNAIGIYADMGATLTSQYEAGGVGPVAFYLMIVNPTFAQIKGASFDMHVEQLNPLGAGVPTWTLASTGFWSVSVPGAEDVAIAFNAPVAVEGDVFLLATAGGFYYGGTACYSILPLTIGEGTGTINILDGDGILFTGAVDAANGGPCFQLGPDGCGVVATEDASFGAVKALYR